MVTSNADLVLDCLHQCVRILQHHQLPMIDLIKEYMILLGKIIKNQKNGQNNDRLHGIGTCLITLPYTSFNGVF